MTFGCGGSSFMIPDNAVLVIYRKRIHDLERKGTQMKRMVVKARSESSSLLDHEWNVSFHLENPCGLPVVWSDQPGLLLCMYLSWTFGDSIISSSRFKSRQVWLISRWCEAPVHPFKSARGDLIRWRQTLCSRFEIFAYLELRFCLLIELSPLKSVECAGAMENQVHCEVRN